MHKHALSHGLAVLICTIASSLLIDVIKEHIPSVNDILHYVSAWIIVLSGIQFSPRALSLLILTSILAAIWGLAFARMQR